MRALKMQRLTANETSKAFMVHRVSIGKEPDTFDLDGRCVEGTLTPGDRFVGLYLTEVDKDGRTSSAHLLAEVDLVVVMLFAYGKVRKRLEQAMTGRVTVRRMKGESPIPDVLLRTDHISLGANV
ncbi:MAG: hypothetical protein HC927_00810 [Deltaproteobacteria bacterium]|nr:hypothetical protein [Deltaproteobacteria bacterium]